MALKKNQKYDKKTGRVMTKDPTKMRVAKKAAAKRRNKRLPPATRAKIKKALLKVRRLGKTLSGRKVKYK